MSTEFHNNSQKISEVMNSLEGMQRAQAPGFLYTRLKARMERELDSGGPLGRWLTRPALALSIAAIILILNATTVLQMWKQLRSSNSSYESAQIVATDYPPVSAYPVYEENSNEP